MNTYNIIRNKDRKSEVIAIQKGETGREALRDWFKETFGRFPPGMSDPEYYIDENGKSVLDEDGSIIYYGDYVYYPDLIEQ